jgi:hypothetical protein
MKKLTIEQMLALDSAFPDGIYETVVEDELKIIYVYLRPEMTEKYRRIFEQCALNVKQVDPDDVTHHKFDVTIKGYGGTTIIKIPLSTFGSVTRNLTSYWKEQNERERSDNQVNPIHC